MKKPLSLVLTATLSLLTLLPAAAASQRAQRLAQVKTLLTQASAASKNAAVKSGIAQAQALVAKKQFEPARAKVASLKTTAATGGDSSTTVLRLVNAEDILTKIARKAANSKKKPAAKK